MIEASGNARRLVGGEFFRFVANGLFAALVHFSAFTLLFRVADLPYASVANLFAAALGIAVSFLGNRYFVFPDRQTPLWDQAWRFGGVYISILALHTALLFVWTDLSHLDYRVGFVIASGLQVVLGYLGNKRLVFG